MSSMLMSCSVLKMLILLLVLLWSATCTESVCSSVSICISNENHTECQGSAVISQLSSIHEYAKSCENFEMQLANGIHIMDTTLEFSSTVQNITIHSWRRGTSSTIVCLNYTGFLFSERKYYKTVYLRDVILENCSNKGKATLYFVYVNYFLENVQIKGSGEHSVYAYQCNDHEISNCTFRNSSMQIKFSKVCSKSKSMHQIKIQNTLFNSGKYGIEIKQKYNCRYGLSIANSTFREHTQSHIVVESKDLQKYPVDISIKNSDFSLSSGIGISLKSINLNGNNLSLRISNSSFEGNVNGALQITRATKIVINDSKFTNSKGTAISINTLFMKYRLRTSVLLNGNKFISNANGAINSTIGTSYLVINNSKLAYNNRTAIFITNGQKFSSNISIFNTTFTSNSIALYIRLHSNAKQDSFTTIRSCKFQKNNLSHSLAYSKSVITVENGQNANRVLISTSIFENNFGMAGNCSCLNITNSDKALLENLLFQNNICSGLTLQWSMITILSWLNVTRSFGQFGGAIQMYSKFDREDKFSSIIIKSTTRLSLINNTAALYGGGIYTDESCENQNINRHCFFQTDSNGSLANNTAIILAGNTAKLGGDAIFGGCLSECYINNDLMNVTDPGNIIYTIISLLEKSSPAAFGEPPYRVAFCSNSSSSVPTCAATHRLNAYRGETFYIPLMIAGSSDCFPIVGFMQAQPTDSRRVELEDLDGRESYKKSNKFCDLYKYSLNADQNNTSAIMKLQIHRDLPSNYAPALLTVVLDDCPAGYEYNKTERKCLCSDLLKLQNVNCVTGTRSLQVPSLTWIGEIKGRPAVSKHCQYCNNKENIITNINNTAQLCTDKREGILCGQCSGNYSLLLGGYRCGDCYKSFYKGFLLVLGFAVIGAAMVLLLLRLNLTISTGLLHGLLFFVNIVYANIDDFLPTSQDDKSKSSMDTLVSLYSTLLAWLNLDFGIATCFFDGYDTYISTWMQFIFPLYVWLIIVTIMLTSRYSSRISRITTSNTVSVLATLLVLPYSKLFTTSIETLSYTDAMFLNDSMRHRIWILDGSIPYLHGKHMPLFILSMLIILLYILPFTLLVVLGPLLLHRSCYRRSKIMLILIPIIRPFLKAFYRPYRETYKYWTGILLLARLVTFLMFNYYQFDARPIKLVTVSSIVIVLLIIWISLSKGDTKSKLASAKYLDLLILVNLGIFAICSVYITTYTEKHLTSQQALSVIMVGGIFAAFCCISAYKLFCQIAFARKSCRKLSGYIPINCFLKHTQGRDQIRSPQTTTTKGLHTATVTHTSIVLSELPEETAEA